MKITFEVPVGKNGTILVSTHGEIKFLPTRIVMTREQISILLAANKARKLNKIE